MTHPLPKKFCKPVWLSGHRKPAQRCRDRCFSELSHGPASLDSLSQQVGLHSRSARDFLDALVALGFLKREDGCYSNTPETDLFLDRNKLSYIGGILEMANHRLYPFWGQLTKHFAPVSRKTSARPVAQAFLRHSMPIQRA